MLNKRKWNQIENDDWNNFNDSESEIETVKKKSYYKIEDQTYWWMQDRF